MMKYIFGVGIILQLMTVMMPAVSAEPHPPVYPSPTQPVIRKLEPHSAKVPEPPQIGLDPLKPTRSAVNPSLSERDRLILERFLIRVIPKTSD